MVEFNKGWNKRLHIDVGITNYINSYIGGEINGKIKQNIKWSSKT